MHGGGREILRKQCSKDPILEVGCQEGEGVPGLSPPLKPGGGGIREVTALKQAWGGRGVTSPHPEIIPTSFPFFSPCPSS